MQNQAYNYNNAPMPPGWEARWVREQNRYFYINHQTKSTQWDDPRLTAQPQATPHAAAASLTPQRDPRGQAHHQQAYPMQDFNARPNQNPSPQGQQQHQEETSVSEEVDQALLAKLHKDFPNATKALLSDMLVGCFNNERETREQLADLGFVKENKSPERRAPAASASPKPQATTTREISQAEKSRMINQFAALFPSIGRDVIDMSLKVVNYDADKGKQLIQAYTQEQAAKGKKKQTVDTSSSSERAGSATSASSSSSNFMPASFSELSENRPQGMPSTSTSNSRVTTSTQPRSRPTQPQQYNNAKNVTNLQIAPRKKVITSQPQQKKTTDAHGPAPAISTEKVKALGPDSSLRNGPDSSLLSMDRDGALGPDTTLCNGPDQSLRYGPDSSHVCGPMGAAGPDRSLTCGADATLRQKDSVLIVGRA